MAYPRKYIYAALRVNGEMRVKELIEKLPVPPVKESQIRAIISRMLASGLLGKRRVKKHRPAAYYHLSSYAEKYADKILLELKENGIAVDGKNTY